MASGDIILAAGALALVLVAVLATVTRRHFTSWHDYRQRVPLADARAMQLEGAWNNVPVRVIVVNDERDRINDKRDRRKLGEGYDRPVD